MLRAIRHEPQAAPKSYTHFQIAPLSGALGAVVTGLDLRDVGPQAFGEIRRAFARHLVLFFPGQNLTPEAQHGFAEMFGAVTEYPFMDPVPAFPMGMIPVGFQPGDLYNFGGDFHSDASFMREPPLATVLSCRMLPPVGGDTVWVNQYLTYRSLSPAMQKLLDGLKAVHSAAPGTTPGSEDYETYSAGNKATPIKANDSVEKWVVHPVLRTHPETGEKALYVNESYTVAFEGMTLRGKPTPPAIPVRPSEAAGLLLSPSLAGRRALHLGQSLHSASRAERLSRRAPADASGHRRSGAPGMTVLAARRRLGRTVVELPPLGLGCAPLGELFVRVDDAAAQAALQAAWDGGIPLFRHGAGIWRRPERAPPRPLPTRQAALGLHPHDKGRPTLARAPRSRWLPAGDVGRRAGFRAPFRLRA